MSDPEDELLLSGELFIKSDLILPVAERSEA
jgi:hypothetical protein